MDEETLLHMWWEGDDDVIDFSAPTPTSQAPTTTITTTPSTPHSPPSKKRKYTPNIRVLHTDKHSKQEKKLDPQSVGVALGKECCHGVVCRHSAFDFAQAVEFRHHVWMSGKEADVLEKIKENLRACVVSDLCDNSWTISSKHFQLKAMGFPVCPTRLYVV